MSAVLLDGKKLAASLEEKQKTLADSLKLRGIIPCLQVILVGGDPASCVYVRNKAAACARIGIQSKTIELPYETTQLALENLIQELNDDPSVHGILVQLPLPAHLDASAALEKIAPQKDVDGFHPWNMGSLVQGKPSVVPCTPRGILALLDSAGIAMDGAHAVVLGRSIIVGKPVAHLLSARNCTVTLCHSHTRNLETYTRSADILVAAVGKAGFVRGEMVRPGAAVIDVGINRVDRHLCGDVDWDTVYPLAGYITPVPGGVGPMTVAMLLQNTLEAACKA